MYWAVKTTVKKKWSKVFFNALNFFYYFSKTALTISNQILRCIALEIPYLLTCGT